MRCALSFAGLLVALTAVVAVAQRGDLPVPADYEQNLVSKGYIQRYLPVQQDTLVPSPADLERGWLVYVRDRNFEVLANSKPAPGEKAGVLRIVATPGEIESASFSAYALKDVPRLAARPNLTVAQGAGAWLAKAAVVEDVLFHPVQYELPGDDRSQKTFLRYPVFIRPASGYPVPAGESRLYWVTVTVPETTPAGIYRAAARLTDNKGKNVDLPLEVEVLPFKLTDKGLPFFGAFLSGAPFASGEWAFMKRYGMDALQWFWGSHSIKIINDNGTMRMDFTEYDAFVDGMKKAGMKGPLVLSLGNSWLGHYEIKLAEAFGIRLLKIELEGQMCTMADMTDPRWESLYIEGLRLIFAHAKEAQWPPLALLIMDEPTKQRMAYHPGRYFLIKNHFPEIPVYGVFFQPKKDPGPLLHSCDIMVANRDLARIKELSLQFGKRFWTYNNCCADESFGKVRTLYGQIPSFYESQGMWFWCWNYWLGNPWNDFDDRQSDADWVAVYPSVDKVEPVRTLAIEAVREGIDDVRYLKTLENMVSERDPARWRTLRGEIRTMQESIFNGIIQDNRTLSDKDFFTTARNDDVEKIRSFVIQEILKTPEK